MKTICLAFVLFLPVQVARGDEIIQIPPLGTVAALDHVPVRVERPPEDLSPPLFDDLFADTEPSGTYLYYAAGGWPVRPDGRLRYAYSLPQATVEVSYDQVLRHEVAEALRFHARAEGAPLLDAFSDLTLGKARGAIWPGPEAPPADIIFATQRIAAVPGASPEEGFAWAEWTEESGRAPDRTRLTLWFLRLHASPDGTRDRLTEIRVSTTDPQAQVAALLATFGGLVERYRDIPWRDLPDPVSY